MKILITDSAHVLKTPDGKYYSPSIYSYSFFKRYLNVFEEVRFAAKVKYVDSIDIEKNLLLSGENLEIFEIPWYQGLKGLSINIFKVARAFRNASVGCDCSIYRMAQIESYFAYFFRSRRKLYAVELVNDPDTFTDIPYLMRKINVLLTKHIIKGSSGTAYVTQKYLQDKYSPVQNRVGVGLREYFENYYSSIELLEADIKEPKNYLEDGSAFQVVHVSNAINSDIKGHTTLIKAIKKVTEQGYNVKCMIIGEGSMLDDYKKMVRDLGLTNHFVFTGRLFSKESVLEKLSNSDLLVLPTHMEGLPRTIIESMAVGLPCLSTPIAGIPELIESKYLFNPTDYIGFSNEIMRLIDNRVELELMSKNNIKKAHNYTKKSLEIRRTQFYNELKNAVRKLI